MQLKNAKFVVSYSNCELFLSEEDNFPAQICVVGRSNVGKSSFINLLANQNKLAKTSSAPGKTRLINIFSFNDGEFFLVDLPGYGYAEAGKDRQKEWAGMTEGYILGAKNLLQVFFLLDARRVPSASDKQMIHYLYYYQIPFTIIITKADKLSKAELSRNLVAITKEIGMGRDNMIITSAHAKQGKEKVAERIAQILSSATERASETHLSENEPSEEDL